MKSFCADLKHKWKYIIVEACASRPPSSCAPEGRLYLKTNWCGFVFCNSNSNIDLYMLL